MYFSLLGVLALVFMNILFEINVYVYVQGGPKK